MRSYSRHFIAVVTLSMQAASCGSTDEGPEGEAEPSTSDPYPDAPEEFDPGPTPAGYTRLVPPPIEGIAPGSDEMYCQWVGTTPDDPQNVLHVLGNQGPAGHHAALYANTKMEPVGTTRLCTDDDMLTVTFLGAVGGEGNDSETVAPGRPSRPAARPSRNRCPRPRRHRGRSR